jgi:hypothetical protein
LVINTDTHSPDNLITRERALQVLVGAGMSEADAREVLTNNELLLGVLRGRLGQE